MMLCRIASMFRFASHIETTIGPFMKKLLLVILVCAAVPSFALASVRLASIFGDGMVLQRNVDVPVWGTAKKGEKITVTIAGRKKNTVADKAGTWMVHLSPMKEGGPYVLTAAGSDTVRLTDILVGEVWLCSGQSNMELAVERTMNAEKEIAAADYPSIRLFTVKRTVSDTPQTSCTGTWKKCDSVSVRSFSGAAYYFGRKLHADLHVPIGLVHSSYGGTPAEAWMSAPALGSDTAFRSILERWKKNLDEYPAKRAAFDAMKEKLTKEWNDASEKAAREGKAAPPRPQEPMGPGNRSTPSGLYNAMIAPLVPFAFKGVIWYQGEANAGRAMQYRTLFPALIRDWRAQWKQELPFYYVQLPNLDRQPEPSKSGWAELREAQLMTLALPKTAMAVTIDIGDPTNLHPKNKLDVGVRLAMLAEGLLYKKETKGTLECQSPVLRSYAIEGARVRIRFDHAAGLHARGGKDVKGFMIAASDKAFVRAQAAIKDGEVIVWSDDISAPVSVRYAWADNPECTLVNDAELPASPFRTDDWTTVTLKFAAAGSGPTNAASTTVNATMAVAPGTTAGLRTFLLDPQALESSRAAIANGAKNYASVVKWLRKEADKACEVAPVSIMEKQLVPPSGSKHDYMSMSKYWWPDPSKKDGLPYIRRDGEVNPETPGRSDEAALNKMIKTVSMLAYGSYFLGEQRYGEHAAAYLRTWFLDTATCMNPNLDYSQSVPGMSDGRSSGIIDSHQLPILIDALGLLDGSTALTAAERNGLQRWFKEYLRWLRESKNGLREAKAKNNHGTWYDVQVASVAMYVGENDLARTVLTESRERRIAAQILPDGTQPEELARTRSFGYSMFNLKALGGLALLGERCGVDLWHYETKDGRSIRKVIDNLLPFISGEKKWTGQQLGEVKLGDMYTLLLDAARVYHDPHYANAAATLPDAKKLSMYSLLFTSDHP